MTDVQPSPLQTSSAQLTEAQTRNVQSSPVQASNAQKVRAFHAAIGAAYPEQPQVPGLTTLELRLTLLREEMQEVEAEFGQLSKNLSRARPADLAPLAHELADLRTSPTARWAAWVSTPTRCSPRSTAPT